MAVGGVPNSVYTLRALVAELKTINQANGYNTDVKTVKMPDYAPNDEDWQTAYAEESPALLLWVSDETDPSDRTNLGEDRPMLRVIIVGIVRQHRGLQEALQALASDVRRIMRANPARDYPGTAATNSWGVTTQPSGKTFDYFYEKSKAGTVGVFYSLWDIEYRFPRSTG